MKRNCSNCVPKTRPCAGTWPISHINSLRSLPIVKKLAPLFSLRLVAGLLMFPAVALAQTDVTISNQTYSSGTTVVEATNSITASTNVTIGSGANVAYLAGSVVSLGAGFQVNSGGLFQISIGQSLHYATGFESSQGYSTGSIAGQSGC